MCFCQQRDCVCFCLLCEPQSGCPYGLESECFDLFQSCPSSFLRFLFIVIFQKYQINANLNILNLEEVDDLNKFDLLEEQEEQEEKSESTSDYSKYKVSELKQMALEKGINITGKKKTEIIALLTSD